MSVHGYHTPVILFIVIVLGYLGLSLAMGARKVYFEPLTTKPDDPEGADRGSGTESGASASPTPPQSSPESGSASGS